MTYYGRFWLGCLLILLSACSAVGSAPNTSATIQAEQTEFVGESTQIASTLRARGTEVMVTAAYAETYVAISDGVNRQLAATMRALIPPTQQVVDTSGEVTPGLIPRPGELATQAPNMAGSSETTVSADLPNMLTEVGAASGVNESDGCTATRQDTFRTNDQVIYATARVLNPVSGTTVSASWAYAGYRFFESSSFTIQTNESALCIWFYIEPSDIQFSPGNWSVRFTFDGVAQEPGVFFSIVQS